MIQIDVGVHVNHRYTDITQSNVGILVYMIGIVIVVIVVIIMVVIRPTRKDPQTRIGDRRSTHVQMTLREVRCGFLLRWSLHWIMMMIVVIERTFGIATTTRTGSRTRTGGCGSTSVVVGGVRGGDPTPIGEHHHHHYYYYQ